MVRFPLRARGPTVGLFTLLSVIVLRSQAPAPLLPPDPLIFAGSGAGRGEVTVLNAVGGRLLTVSPFGAGFAGGVRVASGDIDGDGVTDVIVGMAGLGGHVKAFSGVDGTSLGASTPFGVGFTGGIFLATGDVNADGHDDILLGAGPGRGLARLIDGATQTEIGSGLPFPVPYTGGVTVAMGDVTGDGRADLIFGTAIGGFVRVFDGATLAELVSGFPYGPLFFGGVNVAAGDVDGDGIDEVAIAPRNAGGPVRVYDIRGELVIEGTPFAGVAGVSLALGDLNGDGRDDLVMGAGAGAAPRVRAFSVLDRTSLVDAPAFDAAFTGGVVVAMPSGARTRFTSAASATFTAGVAGSFPVTTSNGSDTALTVGGTLPPGVTFTDHGDGTATLAGTPAAGTGGTYGLTFVATRGAAQVASQPFTLVVQQPTAITSASSTTFAIGGASTFTVTTTGQPVPSAIALDGLLPAGVTFTNNGNGTGTLHGSPSAGTEGTYPLMITAANGIGSPAVQTLTLTVVAGGTPLFTSANAATFSVGALGSFSITTSATPVAGIITVTGTLPTGVTFTNDGNGTATLAGVPDAGAQGTYPLTITADNGVATAPQTFTLTVDPVAGGAPAFTSGNTATFAVGVAGGFDVTTTGFPAAAVTLTGALPSGVTFTDDADGTASLAGTPAAGSAGSYPLQITATNTAGTATQLFTLTASNVGSAPVFTSGATTAFVVGTSGSFAITTAANPPVTSIVLTGALPAFLSFTDNGDGTAALSGTADAGTGGPYNLTFTATNGGAPVTQAFTLSVQQTAAITSANTRAFTVGIADSFTVTTAGVPVPSVAIAGTLPTGVTYTDNGDGTGTIAGTAAPGTVGSHPVTLSATNGVGAPAVQSFTLAVTQNTPPTLDLIADPAAILEDAAPQTINLTGITAGAGDSQPLAVTASSSDPSVIPHPTVTYSTPATTGTTQYTPVADASGTAVVTVTVTDGGLDNDLGTPGDNGVFSRTFTVAVTSVNDAPTLDAIANPAAIDEDAGQQTIDLAGISTGGGETQPLQVTATSDTPGLIPDPTPAYTAPATTGSLAYTPVAGESGTAIVTVTVTDGGDDNDLGTAGDNLTATRTFTVTVNDVDDPPTLDAIADPVAINEDAGLQTVNLSGISAGTGETATLVVTAVSGNPALIPNPTVTYTSPSATGSLSYMPVANTSGSAPITVTVSDGGATTAQRTFTVVVNDVNDAPTFTPGGDQTVSEDAAAQTVNGFLGAVSAGPNEADQIVTVTTNNVTNPSLFSAAPSISAAGVLTYTPAADQFGTSTVTYTVADNGGTANGGVDSVGPLTFTITINAVNDPPTLNEIADPSAILEDAAQQTINLAGISTGSAAESAQPLQITAVSGNTGLVPNPAVAYLSPSATGLLDYTPVANAFGSAVITVTVTDGGLDDDLGTAGDNGTLVRTFTVNVTAVNDAPSFTKGGDQTVDEDAGAQTVNPWATGVSAGPGESGQTVSFEITGNTNPSLFSAGPSVSAAGVLTYTPAANQNGSATITLRATDDGGIANGGIDASAPQTFTITVNAVNDPPVAQAKSYSAQANMAIIGLTGLLAGVTDADAGINGCTPTFSVAGVSGTTPAGGDVVNLDPVSGTFDFNPPPGITGPVTFTYTVQDTGCPGTAASAPATVTVSVGGPVIWFVDDSAAGGGDGRLTSPFDALSSAATVDAAGDVIFLYSGSYPAGITLAAGESLMGQGAVAGSFDLLMGISPPAGTVPRPSIGGTRPTISVASGTAVTLASGNVVHGLNVSNTNGSGIVGSAVGTLALANFDVTVTGGSALSLTTSGTVTGTGADNNLTSTNGTALNVQNVTIGASGVTFRSVSANGGTNGIVLNDTGSSGRLTVTGNGGACSTALDCSGGAIQNSTGIGLLLTNTRNVSLTRVYIGHTGSHGVSGTGMTDVTGGAQPTFEIRNSMLDSPGDGDNESALYFNTLAATNVTGRLVVADTTIQNFEDVGIHVTNVSGTLTIDVTDVLIDNNSDTNGEEGIDVAANGTANITLNVTGTRTGNTSTTMFTDLEGGGINAVAQNSGVLDVNLTGLVDRGTGGPDNFPTPPAWTFAADGSSSAFTFDITNNSIVDMSGDGLFIGHEGTIMGRLTNNVISGTATGDAIRLDTDTASTTTATILIQGNNLGNDATFPGIGGDGIQVLQRDGTKTLNLTIEGNQIKNTNSEGIRYFADDDVSGGGPGNAVRIATNAFGSNGLVDLSDSIVMISQDPGTDVCTNITANTSVEGITLQQSLSATFQITQADTAALAAANGGALVTANGTVTFNGTCSNPPLPTNP